MEKEVAKWAALAQKATEKRDKVIAKRDEAIRKMRSDDKASIRAIATAAQLSIGGVQKILNK